MDAERGHAAGRALLGIRPPGVRRAGEVGREIPFQMEDFAQPALFEDRPQREEIGRETPVVADRQRDSRLVHGLDRSGRVGRGQGQRLFAEDVLAGGGGGDDLAAMKGVRRREHDRVDIRVGERLIVVRAQHHPLGRRIVLDLRRRARDGAGEPDRIGPLAERVDERLAPAAEADDGRADHGQASVFSRGTSMSYQGLLSRVLVSSTWSALTSVYSFSPSSPNSRPMPDCL